MKKIYGLLIAALFVLAVHAQNPQPSQQSISYHCAPCGCPDDGKSFDQPGSCSSCNMALSPVLKGLDVTRSPFSRKTVSILVYDGADIMDVTGPWSVFEHAGFRIRTVGKTTDTVRLGMFMKIKPQLSLRNMPETDVVVIPGGGMAEHGKDTAISQWLKKQTLNTETILSVCSGAFFLGNAGLLKGKKATTFASLIPELSRRFPESIVVNDVQYTDNGQIITSAGLSSGIEAAFHVVAKYYGQGRAQDIANHMEYAWKPSTDYARTQLADNFIRDIRELVALFSSEFISSFGDNHHWEYQYRISEKADTRLIIPLIHKELAKISHWAWVDSGYNHLQAIRTMPDLGEANISIEITDSDEGRIAVIKATRSGLSGDSGYLRPEVNIHIGKTVTIPSVFSDLPVVEPHISAHPLDKDHLLVAGMVVTDIENPYQSSRLSSFTSQDGGQTWEETTHDWWGYDPWTVLMADGQAIISWIGTKGSFQHKFPVQFLFSEDGGKNWLNHHQTLSGNHDGTKLTHENGTTYFTSVRFREHMSADVVLYGRNSQGDFQHLATVDGHGKRLNFCEPAILSDGSVLVPASDFLKKAWVWKYRPESGSLGDSSTITLQPGGAMGYMRMEADPYPGSPFHNSVYFVRALGRGENHDGVWLNYSRDGGNTWTQDIRVDQFGDQSGGKARLASLSVNQQGILLISWIDSREDKTQKENDLYVAVSENGGESFGKPVKVTEFSSDPHTPANGDAAVKFPGGGHYLDIATRADGSFQLVWSDSRRGHFELQTATIIVELLP